MTGTMHLPVLEEDFDNSPGFRPDCWTIVHVMFYKPTDNE